jgi:hypothetical protein
VSAYDFRKNTYSDTRFGDDCIGTLPDCGGGATVTMVEPCMIRYHNNYCPGEYQYNTALVGSSDSALG